ncbi:MAG: hypothetical protein DWB56_00280 [Candidatus Jettenia sp.]|uniref:Uncharacterized protein n=1 Tax=Candidatus Jettenia caeni TaxID=247490 RepID=I3ILJ1_9BACT|nr:MAG: hypothetical protein EDM77_00280 [Candidatus Jettenia sp. AMX1]MBC6927390.1 hypothetical protein [Candidatus Jettenia sp.]MCE7879073.1 hypothetical protein [Candidatus Jettenia sp. AMX1]MCQ3925819.1 hypothetical protein [Candidatus Jettenia sp.]GAB62586.1 hypothetical protein KSU1_C0990 [Candidatus Jettenia caeni]
MLSLTWDRVISAKDNCYSEVEKRKGKNYSFNKYCDGYFGRKTRIRSIKTNLVFTNTVGKKSV